MLFWTITTLKPKARSIETKDSNKKIKKRVSVLFDSTDSRFVFTKNRNHISSLISSTESVEKLCWDKKNRAKNSNKETS